MKAENEIMAELKEIEELFGDSHKNPDAVRLFLEVRKQALLWVLAPSAESEVCECGHTEGNHFRKQECREPTGFCCCTKFTPAMPKAERSCESCGKNHNGCIPATDHIHSPCQYWQPRQPKERSCESCARIKDGETEDDCDFDLPCEDFSEWVLRQPQQPKVEKSARNQVTIAELEDILGAPNKKICINPDGSITTENALADMARTYRDMLLERLTQLAYAVEELPASEQQTKISIMVTDLIKIIKGF